MADGPVDEDVRILLIDDHRMVAEAMAQALTERPGIRAVGTAASIEEARTILRRAGADVILTDYRLPDSTGTAVARELMEEWPDVRVLIVTAVEDDEVLTEALEAGCCGCVRKSAGIDQLISAVYDAHAGKVVIPSALLGRVMAHLRERPDAARYGLTPRELEVLRLLATGLPSRAMAADMGVTYHSLRNYVHTVIQKLGAHSRLEAVAIALREGVIPGPDR